MKKHFHILVSASLLILSTCLKADSWSYPSENLVVESGNELYRFTAIFPSYESSGRSYHTLPPKDASSDTRNNRSKHCIGTLEILGEEEPRELWRRKLINRVTPLDAIVTDNGKYTVTFDNWFGVGEDPIVIYDSRGKLIKRHSLKSLDLVRFTEGRQIDENTWTSEGLITRSISSVYWRRDALTFLSEDQERLFVRMHWGHVLAIELSNGNLLKENQFESDLEYIESRTLNRVKELLESKNGYERKTGAVLASSVEITEIESRLIELLSDSEYNESYSSSEGSYKNYYVREAACDSLKEHGIDTLGIILREKFGPNEKTKLR